MRAGNGRDGEVLPGKKAALWEGAAQLPVISSVFGGVSKISETKTNQTPPAKAYWVGARLGLGPGTEICSLLLDRRAELGTLNRKGQPLGSASAKRLRSWLRSALHLAGRAGFHEVRASRTHII